MADPLDDAAVEVEVERAHPQTIEKFLGLEMELACLPEVDVAHASDAAVVERLELPQGVARDRPRKGKGTF